MNLVLLCLDCHRVIHADEAVAAAEGWIVWHDPDVTPLLRAARTGTTPGAPPSRGWVLLVPDGSLEYLCHQEGERLVAFTNGPGAMRLLEPLAQTG